MNRRRLTPQLAAAIGAAAVLLGASPAAAPARRVEAAQLALPPAAQLESDRGRFRDAANRGIADARSNWFDSRRGWYDGLLNDRRRYPLATIWSAVHLFEAVDAKAIGYPTAQSRKAVRDFAAKAERYWDPALRPSGGYAPYLGDRGGRERAWFDDNGWWGIAFVDAYRATGDTRYLGDAARALRFIDKAAWASDGGLWWETAHSHKAGEALASGSALAALLYQYTGKSAHLATARKFMSWGDRHFLGDRGLYARSDSDPTPMPYVQGPMIGAHAIVCRTAGDQAACDRAELLAETSLDRFGADLNHGPQFDTIYMRWMLELYRSDGDPRWYALARRNGLRALTSARDSRGLYMRAWDGGPATAHQGVPGSLQTHAATVSLFAWLAATPVPAG